MKVVNIMKSQNIHEEARIFRITDDKMVTLSIKRKPTLESQKSSKKMKFLGKEKSQHQLKKAFQKMSAAEILQGIDSLLIDGV